MNSPITNILAIGDLHIRPGSKFQYEAFKSEIIRTINEKQPDIIIFLGDILHTHEKIHSVSMNMAHDLMDLIRSFAPLYVIVGNHDLLNNRQFLTTNHWMNGMKRWKVIKNGDKVLKHRITIVDTAISEVHNNNRFTFIPYVPNGRFIEGLNTIEGGESVWNQSVSIFAHQEFLGCQMKSIKSEHGDEWDSDKPRVISGHIHGYQKLHGGNVLYTGACMQHNFGDSPNKNVFMFSFKDNKEHKPPLKLQLDLPQKIIIEVDNLDEKFNDIRDRIINDTKNKYKLLMHLKPSEFKVFMRSLEYKQLIAHDVKILISARHFDRSRYSYSADDRESFDEILSKCFEEEVNESSCDCEMMRNIMSDIVGNTETVPL